MLDERQETRPVPEVVRLLAAGRAAGIDALGVADASPFDDVRAEIEARKAAGLHGGMQFTYRNPARSTDPSRLVPGARSIVVGARRYASAEPGPPADAGPVGRVARYARADHYAALRSGLEAVAALLRGDGWTARVACDDNALVDRAAARRAGIGWYGKSANILLPGLGSWFVLGSVVTDAPLPPSDAALEDGCGSCARCIEACPTGAIVAPGVVDARSCLAWLVQAPGAIPEAYRVSLGDRIYGCDDCQEVCPPNRAFDRRRPDHRQPDHSETERGPDEAACSGDHVNDHREGGAWVPLLALLDHDDRALLDAHGRWYIAARDPRHLRRNALVALGNVGRPGDRAVSAVLDRFARGDDPLLAEHARWAVHRLHERAGGR